LANHPSAQKRNRQRVKRTLRNRAIKSAVRTHVKTVRAAVAAKDAKAAKKALAEATVAIDQASEEDCVAKGVEVGSAGPQARRGSAGLKPGFMILTRISRSLVGLVTPLAALACGAAPCPSPPSAHGLSSEAHADSSAASVAKGPAVPLFAEPDSAGPKSFLVVGPFPNALGSDAKGRPGLDRDYLTTVGGEAAARFAASTTVAWEGQTFGAREATLDARSTLDFVKLFGADTDRKTAYAYAEWTAGKPIVALALFGSDDGAVVWLNGRQVHRVAVDRALNRNEDRFELSLVAGTNRLLVKVDNGTMAWGFALRVLDDEGRRRLEALDARRHLERFEPGPTSGSYLLEESFPEIEWSHSAAAEHVFRRGSLQVRWYGPDLRRSERPQDYGPYTAVTEATTLDGYTYRQMLTFAKVPDRSAAPLFRVPPFTELPVIDVPARVDVPLNDAQRAEVSRFFWHGAAEAFWRGEESAMAALGLLDLGEHPPPGNEPPWLHGGFIRAAEHQLRVRMQLEGRAPKVLAPPERLANPAPELRNGSETQAGVRPGTIQKLRAVASAWAKDDTRPFVLLVARRGVVFLHEGFNGFGKDATFRPASIGKTIAGLTFARAVDQGLVDLDQPVGSVLPDWRNERTAKVTFRHCFNHVSGLTEHASHGGLFNAYLDNALLVQDAAFATPGVRFQYNGDDVNLAGKALEMIAGQSIWRLLYESMERPFDEPVRQFDLGFGDALTAMYLAKIGQMILQDGSYGSYRFFKTGFLEALRPRRIAEFAPMLDDPKIEAGIGLAWMPDPPGPRESGVLGPNVLGHGASSGVTWRIDLSHHLIVVVGRDGYKQLSANDEWATKLAKVLADALVN
jgi:small subunit ribosomal protein S20